MELPNRPEEFHPGPLTDPDVNLSIHKKAAAFHQDKEFLRLPVESISTRVTCPLWLHGNYPASSLLRSSAPLIDASVNCAARGS